MHIVSTHFQSSLIIFKDATSWGEIVDDVKSLSYGYLKPNVFAEAKMFTISNKRKEPILAGVIILIALCSFYFTLPSC